MRMKPSRTVALRWTKRAVTFCWLLALLMSLVPLSVKSNASPTARYQESFANLAGGAGVMYYNIMPSEVPLETWIPTEGARPVQLDNGYAKGGVRYQVQNAQQVAVSIATYGGTMVSQQQEGYALGLQQFQRPFEHIIAQGRYSPATQGVYTAQSEGPMVARFHIGSFQFYKTEQMPANTVPFGVHVQTSNDGIAYRTLPLNHQGGQGNTASSLVYETFYAPVPAGTQYIKVEINQCNQLMDSQGNTAAIRRAYKTRLVGVEISGYPLIFGPPEEILTEEELTTPPKETQGEETTSKEEKPLRDPKKKPVRPKEESLFEESYRSEKKSPSSLESEKSPVEKFEGSIPIPGEQGKSSQRKKTTKSAGSASPSAKESGPEEAAVLNSSPVSEEEVSQEPLVYQVVDETAEKSPAITGITFYIVIATGFILFLLLRPRGQ